MELETKLAAASIKMEAQYDSNKEIIKREMEGFVIK